MNNQASLIAWGDLNKPGPVTGSEMPVSEAVRRRAQVLQAVRDNPGNTALEISRLMGYGDPNKVRPRVTELEKDGYIFYGSLRKCSISGKLANTLYAARRY